MQSFGYVVKGTVLGLRIATRLEVDTDTLTLGRMPPLPVRVVARFVIPRPPDRTPTISVGHSGAALVLVAPAPPQAPTGSASARRPPVGGEAVRGGVSWTRAVRGGRRCPSPTPHRGAVSPQRCEEGGQRALFGGGGLHDK